jgi:hypothetical protein
MVQRTLILLALVTAPPLGAQQMDHHHDMAMPLTAKADSQVAHSKAIAKAWSTPEAAKAAGYQPRFGDVPLQGEHYTNRDLVLAGTFDLDHPPVLMFSTIKGVQTLVGAAYAYEVKAEEPTPEGFDGDADQWHEHPFLALPGKRLVMTHVWFVPSPGGPFAHDNPSLPFLELGIPVPTAGWLDFPAYRQLGLALAISQDGLTPRLKTVLAQYPDVGQRTTAERDSIRALVPKLEAAQKAGNAAKYRELAKDAGRHASVILESWKTAPTNPTVRGIVAKALDELFGGDPFKSGAEAPDHE